MMPNESRYKNLAIVFGILALVFAGLFFYEKSDDASKELEGVSDNITECREGLAAWQVKYGTGTVSAEAQGELSNILESCEGDL